MIILLKKSIFVLQTLLFLFFVFISILKQCFIVKITKSNLIIMFSAAFLIALSLLIIKSFTVTALTTVNCPLDYNLIAGNTTSGGQSTVELIYGRIFSASDQAILQESFSQGDTNTIGGYVTKMSILMPFILIAVAFGITYVIAVCCCIFQKSCPPCQSWKRDFSKNPYEKKELKCTSVFTIIFALIIFVVAVVALNFYPTLQQEITLIKCSLFYSLDIALNGDTNNFWGGFSQISAQSSNISSLLTSAQTSLTATFGGSNTLPSNLAALRQQNANIYTNNYMSKVRSPNHVPSPDIAPLFINVSLGPSSNGNTMTGDIQSGIATTQKVTIQASKVFTSAQLLSNSISNIQSRFNASIQGMNSNSNYLDITLNSIQSFSNNIIDGVFIQFLYFIQAILAVIIICSILIFLGVIATNYFQIFGCKVCVHLGWFFYGLMYFGVIALCFIFFSVGGISYSFCNFYGDLLQNQTKLSTFAFSTKPSAFNRIFQTLTPCFYGDGSIAKTYSITRQTYTVNKLFAEINTYSNMQDSSKSTYIDLSIAINKINDWITIMQNYRSGIYIDVSPTILSEDSHVIALQNINILTNNGTNSPYPTCTSDNWVFDTTNCTRSATEAIYTSSLNSGTSFTTTGYMCISFNQKFSSSSLNIWSESDIMNRYVVRRFCQNDTRTFDRLKPYISSLVSYRDSRINLYQSLKDQLNNLLNTNNALNNQITAFTQKIIEFNVNTSSLNSLMTNSINGMDQTSNCTVIANNLRLFYNLFCVNFIYKSVQLGICSLILLVMMVGGMLTGSVFGIRYNRIQKDPKVYLKQLPNIFKDELSSSKQQQSESQQSSSSSSSSDDD